MFIIIQTWSFSWRRIELVVTRCCHFISDRHVRRMESVDSVARIAEDSFQMDLNRKDPTGD